MLVVEMPTVTSSDALAPSSVLVPSSKARSAPSSVLAPSSDARSPQQVPKGPWWPWIYHMFHPGPRPSAASHT